MISELLPAPLPNSAQSSLPPEEKRRHLIELVVNSVSAPASKRTYRTGVEQFFDWWSAAEADLAFSRNLMQRYRVALQARGLAPRTINLRLAAVRKLAEEAAAEHLLPDEKASEIQSVKGAKILGSPVGNWLNGGQTEHLLALPDTSTFKGKRDHALLVLGAFSTINKMSPFVDSFSFWGVFSGTLNFGDCARDSNITPSSEIFVPGLHQITSRL